MNTLYLHVGPHKTGTTAIQKFCLDNHQALYRHKLAYPKRYRRIFGHHDFRPLLAEKSMKQDDIDFLADQEHNFLLSSEDLISLDKEHFNYLRQQLEYTRIIPVFAWRRASFKLYSIWQETIKHGGTDTFHAYYHDHLARPAQSQMLSPDLKLSMLASVFGKENLKVLDYDASDKEKTLLPDFLKMLNIPWEQAFVTSQDNPDAVNRSMDILDIEVIRALNHSFKKHFGIEGAAVRVAYQQQQSLLQQSGLAELKALISAYEQTLTVGNYFIDNRAEQQMVSKFSDNILNYQANLTVKKLKISRPEWILDTQAQSILEQLASVLKDAVKSC